MPQHDNNTTGVSDEINEIMGTPPTMLVRWGNLLIFLLVVAGFALCALISYPDVIEGKVIIVSKQNVLLYSPPEDSRLIKLFVRDGDSVKAGSPLYQVQTSSHVDTVTASLTGAAHFQYVLREGILLDGKTPMILLTGSNNEYSVVIDIPLARSGKIKPGQKAFISLDQFPKQDYGELETEIVSRPVPHSPVIMKLHASMPRNAVTTSRQRIEIGMQSSGTATIIIDRRSILSRLVPLGR